MPLIAKGLFYYTKTFLRLQTTKFLLGIIATLLLTLTFFIYKHNRTLQDLEHEKYKNLSLESKLQDSNNALEKIQLDTQSYLKGRDKEIQQIQNKYTKLLQEHTRQERALQQANTHSLHTQKHATQNHISSQVKLDNSYNATDTSKKSVSKHSLHTQNRDVSDITYPQHDVLNILRFLDVSTSQDVSATPQHDVCFLSQYDVDVSGLSPQHDTKDQDMRSRHSEGVLQSKTTEESTTESKIKGLDYSHSKDMTKNIRCFAYAQHDKKHFSYSEIPNNSNSNSNSFQNGNTCMLSLQHCQLQIQTAKDMLQQALQ